MFPWSNRQWHEEFMVHLTLLVDKTTTDQNVKQFDMHGKKAFKWFVSNRWLSVGPVCERIIENWAGLTKYFLKTEHSAPIMESSMYKQITTSLQEGNIMLARLHFIVSIANLFKPFLTKFQSESVSIHLLFVTLFTSTVEHMSLQCRSGSMQREGKS